ncbi:hypothetical protein [Methanolobus sp. ZRKC5]|uniref:hypothetical protein n=1 Tax=unclassified Methanolobus TaxID=2629569 RepID=UPI00313B69E6
MSGRNNIGILFFTALILIFSYTNYLTDYAENYEALLAKLIQASLIILLAYILNTTVKNYTHDFSFIWDEVTIILALGSNWEKAKKIALDPRVSS